MLHSALEYAGVFGSALAFSTRGGTIGYFFTARFNSDFDCKKASDLLPNYMITEGSRNAKA